MIKNIKSKASIGFMWIFSGAVGQNLAQFLSLIILARLLTPSDFGVVSAALIVVNFLKIFTELGVGPAIVQKQDLSDDDIGTANTLSVLMGVSFFFILFFSSNAIASFFRMDDLVRVIQAMSFVLLISGPSVVAQGVLQRDLRFKVIGLVGLSCYMVSNIFVAVPLALMGYGVWALVVAQIVQAAVLLGILIIMIPKTRLYCFSFESAKNILNYGFGQTLGRLANFIANQGDNIVVGRVMSAESLGVYGRAYQLMTMPANLIATVLDKVLFPIMSRMQNENDRLVNAYVGLTSLIAAVSIPISVFIYLFADNIVGILLGDQWEEVGVLLMVFSTVMVFRMNYKLSDSLSRAKGSVYRRAWRQTVYAGSVFLGAFIGHYSGLLGVSIGVSIAILVNFLLMLHLSRSLIGFQWADIIGVYVKHLLFSSILFLFLGFLKRYILSGVSNDFAVIFIALLAAVLFMVAIWRLGKGYMKSEIDFIWPVYAKLASKFIRIK